MTDTTTQETPMHDGTTTLAIEAPGERPDQPSPATRRRGRPRRPVTGASDTLRLQGHTAKSYGLGDGPQQTIRYLRLIVNQRQIPDNATVAIEGGRITIEWSD